MSTSVTCPTCGPREPDALEAPAPAAAWFSLFKDWRVWAVAFGATMLTGMVIGVLHLNSAGIGAGSGVVTAMYMVTRVKGLKKCRTCGAIVRTDG